MDRCMSPSDLDLSHDEDLSKGCMSILRMSSQQNLGSSRLSLYRESPSFTLSSPVAGLKATPPCKKFNSSLRRQQCRSVGSISSMNSCQRLCAHRKSFIDIRRSEKTSNNESKKSLFRKRSLSMDELDEPDTSSYRNQLNGTLSYDDMDSGVSMTSSSRISSVNSLYQVSPKFASPHHIYAKHNALRRDSPLPRNESISSTSILSVSSVEKTTITPCRFYRNEKKLSEDLRAAHQKKAKTRATVKLLDKELSKSSMCIALEEKNSYSSYRRSLENEMNMTHRHLSASYSSLWAHDSMKRGSIPVDYSSDEAGSSSSYEDSLSDGASMEWEDFFDSPAPDPLHSDYENKSDTTCVEGTEVCYENKGFFCKDDSVPSSPAILLSSEEGYSNAAFEVSPPARSSYHNYHSEANYTDSLQLCKDTPSQNKLVQREYLTDEILQRRSLLKVRDVLNPPPSVNNTSQVGGGIYLKSDLTKYFQRRGSLVKKNIQKKLENSSRSNTCRNISPLYFDNQAFSRDTIDMLSVPCVSHPARRRQSVSTVLPTKRKTGICGGVCLLGSSGRRKGQLCDQCADSMSRYIFMSYISIIVACYENSSEQSVIVINC